MFSLCDVSAFPDRDRVVAVAAGELDLSTVPLLRRQIDELLDVGWFDLRVDLREVTFMDSCGVHLLLDTHRRTRTLGGTLTVIASPGPVTGVLEPHGGRPRADRGAPPHRLIGPARPVDDAHARERPARQPAGVHLALQAASRAT